MAVRRSKYKETVLTLGASEETLYSSALPSHAYLFRSSLRRDRVHTQKSSEPLLSLI